MKLLIAAGGTGGHVYPALSIAETFRNKGHYVLFAGRDNSFEKYVYENSGFQVLNIHSSLLEFAPLPLLRFSLNTARGIKDAFRILKKEKPDAVLGGGGYVSAPVLFAAFFLGIPYFIYEQNIIPGRTNRIFGRNARLIFTGFPDIYKFFDPDRTVFSGNPVRKKLLTTEKSEGLKYFGFSEKLPVLLVFGGSGGARAINEVFSNICEEFSLKTNVQIIFITGKRDFEEISKRVRMSDRLKVLPYLEEMEFALSASDFAVSRAGAMTLTELALTETPGIVIPFPFARDNHQFKNALYLKNKGCVDIINQDELSEEVLLNKLVYYFSDISIIDKMKCKNVFPRNSAEIIYKSVMEKINE